MNHDHSHTQNNTCTHGCCETKDMASHGCCGGNDAHHHAVSDTISFTCPMHPNVKQDKPGSCPECGMNLAPEKKIEN